MRFPKLKVMRRFFCALSLIFIISSCKENPDTTLYKIFIFSALETIKEQVAQDSLAKNIEGWWRLDKPRLYPIKLLNYSKEIYDFTVNFKDNGQAFFYINHSLDSAVYYNWSAEPNSIELIRYCVIGGYPLLYIDKNKHITIIKSVYFPDTVMLKRCPPIQK